MPASRAPEWSANGDAAIGSPDLLNAALAYHRRGWCVIPVMGKEPTVKWARYQRQRPSESTLRRWFDPKARRRPTGLALVLGPVSGNVVVRDFDSPDGFTGFKAEHPELAAALPRSATKRGCHVFVRAEFDGVTDLGDGEMRGTRSIVVLPPSVHPDGGEYRWIREPTNEIPKVDLAVFGVAPATERRRNTETQIRSDGDTPAIVGGVDQFLDDPRVEESIEASIPLLQGKRNRATFNYARRLKAIPELAPLSPLQLDSLVHKWHERAKVHAETQEYYVTQADFAYGWNRVRCPWGVGLKQHWDASEGETVKGLEALAPPLARLAAFCRRVFEAGGGTPFYLSCRTLAKLRGDSKDEANRDLGALESFGVLGVAQKGTRGVKGRATRFEYVWHSD